MALFLSVFILSVFTPFAYANTWPLPSSRPSYSLGFHQTYHAGVHTYAHSGIDASASAGSQIFAPVAGTVSFTGSIPSGDSFLGASGAKKTMLGVSIKMDSGKIVTLMPFSQIQAARGQRVIPGQALGTLAASGDRSSKLTHLHMGLKKNGIYYDPMTLFGLFSQSETYTKDQACAGVASLSASAYEHAASASTAAQALKTQAEQGQSAAAEGSQALASVFAPRAQTALEGSSPRAQLHTSTAKTATQNFSPISSAGGHYLSQKKELSVFETFFGQAQSLCVQLNDSCIAQACALQTFLRAVALSWNLPYWALVTSCSAALSLFLLAAVYCLKHFISEHLVPERVYEMWRGQKKSLSLG